MTGNLNKQNGDDNKQQNRLKAERCQTLATEEEYMKRWSKLQKELYLIIDPEIDFQIHWLYIL